jgi:hypothetical protein
VLVKYLHGLLSIFPILKEGLPFMVLLKEIKCKMEQRGRRDVFYALVYCEPTIILLSTQKKPGLSPRLYTPPPTA